MRECRTAREIFDGLVESGACLAFEGAEEGGMLAETLIMDDEMRLLALADDGEKISAEIVRGDASRGIHYEDDVEEKLARLIIERNEKPFEF